jgi:hypothetical protein
VVNQRNSQTSPAWLLLIAVVFWLFFMNGLSTVKHWGASRAPADVAGTISRGVDRALATSAPLSRPTAPIAAPIAGSGAPAVDVKAAIAAYNATQQAAAAVVVPRGMPQIATSVPTAAPPEPTAPPPSIQAVYTALQVTNTPIPLPACEVGKETYVTTPVRVLNPRGLPIGEARGRSCVSEADAHENAAKNAQEAMDRDKALHPENWR